MLRRSGFSLVLIALVAVLLSACGGDDDAPQADDDGAPQMGMRVEGEPIQGGEITVFLTGPGGNPATVAVVTVDPDNGLVVLQRYLAADDCGPQVNPVIVAGQIHGGVAQGTGPALWEGAVYDDNGQLLTGSMMDYALPRADMVPDIETLSTVTPSPSNPLGVKGMGETGTIASTITIYNAVIDALKPLGVTKLEMPLTPERVWQAIQQAKGA